MHNIVKGKILCSIKRMNRELIENWLPNLSKIVSYWSNKQIKNTHLIIYRHIVINCCYCYKNLSFLCSILFIKKTIPHQMLISINIKMPISMMEWKFHTFIGMAQNISSIIWKQSWCFSFWVQNFCILRMLFFPHSFRLLLKQKF